MDKTQLSPEDKQTYNAFEKQFGHILETVERARQFKVGDYLILHISDYSGKMCLKKNSYGAPIKYKVVFVDRLGIAFIKTVNKKGEPIGKMYSCVGTAQDDYRHMDQKFELSLDPDYVDSMILEDGYDPSQLHKSKQQIWKEVTQHNKLNKINTYEPKDIMAFFANVKVGDIVWTSINGYYLVQDKKNMSVEEWNKICKWGRTVSRSYKTIDVFTVKDKKGKVIEITPLFFWHKALYKEKPRTYKELNI